MFTQILKLAFQNIRANLLRAILTIVIIAFGITALVGILTAIDSAINSMSENFSTLGANSFSIEPRYMEVQATRRGRQLKQARAITFDQAVEFKQRYDAPARVAISYGATGSATVKYKDEKTNPTVTVRGVDENELAVRSREIEAGRFFNSTEIDQAEDKVVIGSEVIDKLFEGEHQKALGKDIIINGRRYRVIGTMASQGAAINQSADRIAYIPVTNARIYYAGEDSNFDISLGVSNAAEVTEAIAVATGVMRKVRDLAFNQENDFEIEQSDTIVTQIREATKWLRLAAVLIAVITLLGATIGLMNIMLVSVTERTKEIGVMKAVGATRQIIINQFLAEAVLICQMGGVLGIILGILIGNVVTIFLGGSFIIPWAWILTGLITCFVVGVLAGIYPAIKAASLDPIESLRYE